MAQPAHPTALGTIHEDIRPGVEPARIVGGMRMPAPHRKIEETLATKETGILAEVHKKQDEKKQEEMEKLEKAGEHLGKIHMQKQESPLLSDIINEIPHNALSDIIRQAALKYCKDRYIVRLIDLERLSKTEFEEWRINMPLSILHQVSIYQGLIVEESKEGETYIPMQGEGEGVLTAQELPKLVRQLDIACQELKLETLAKKNAPADSKAWPSTYNRADAKRSWEPRNRKTALLQERYLFQPPRFASNN